MFHTKEDNTVAVLQRAIRYFGISVTNSTIKGYLRSHPNYPTLKSVCDVLEEWKIEHYPLKYQIEEIRGIKIPFIVHLKNGGGQLAFVNRIRDSKVSFYYSETKKTIPLNAFLEMCSGAVILIYPTEKAGENEFRRKMQNEILNNSILPLTIGALILFVLASILIISFQHGFGLNRIQFYLFLTKSFGMALSLMLVLHEFEIHTLIGDKLCHVSKKTDCNAVLNDKASKIFGWFGWADIGFIYFTGGFFTLLIILKSSDYNLFTILSALCLPYPIFSIYYQGFVLKKWCMLCIGVQILLIIEFLLLFPQFTGFQFSLTDLITYALIFSIIGIVYLLFTMYFRAKAESEVHYYKYLGFQRNPEVLKALLSKQQYHNIPIKNQSIVFGSKDSVLTITAFLSLNCSYCTRAFNIMLDILKECANIRIHLVLISRDINVINVLYFLMQQNKQKEVLDLLGYMFNKVPYSKTLISERLCIPDDFTMNEETKAEELKLFIDLKIAGTPSYFINGYALPLQYSIEDVKYFSNIFETQKYLFV